ncbi:MAG: acyl-CoA synthetase [Deltaproteobacteria bacterium]|nr:acyl-CoA synthetase [Deltaproteobacteria bacterium]
MSQSFWRHAERNPGALALVTPDGRTVTAGELLTESNRIVHGLRALGLSKGDCFATVLPNGLEMLALELAALQAGFYVTPVNHHLTGPEIAYIASDCEAKALVTHERFAPAVTAAADEIGFPAGGRFAIGSIPGFRPYSDLVQGRPGALPDDRTAGSVMHYTSGTTGRPKGVRRAIPPLDPDVVATLYGGFLGLFGIKPESDNVHLCGSPLYHTAVLMFTTCSLHAGHAVVVMDRWTPEETLRLIEKHRVTTSHMVPTQFHRLLALPDAVRTRHDLSSLRHVVHAAAPCPPEIKRRMIEWWGPVIYEYYAATEGGGTLVTPQEWIERPGTVGRAWTSSEVRILDDAGNACAPGQIGTVYMKLGLASFEYHKDKAKTEGSRREGFFTVGDVGYLDDAGYLFLCDRKADMIISGGVNIYPAEVEAVLLTHPAVADVAVFGIPDEDWGEQVKAVIEPAPGVTAGPALAGEILAFCLERTAKYKAPRSIDFIDAMPRDPNGKLYKRKLRDPYWKGRERSI